MVSQWNQPQSAIRGPDSTLQSVQSVAPEPMTVAVVPSTAQGLGILPNNPIPLDPGFLVGPRHFEPTPEPVYNFSAASDDLFAPGVAPRLESSSQNRDFSPFSTLGSTSVLVPPSDGGLFNPRHAPASLTTFASGFPIATEKQVVPLAPPRGERTKRRKLDDLYAGEQGSSMGLPSANEGTTTGVTPSIPAPSFDRPPDMPKSEYLRLLYAKFVAESELGE